MNWMKTVGGVLSSVLWILIVALFTFVVMSSIRF